MLTEAEMWSVDIERLVDETLPKVAEAHPIDYVEKCRAVLNIRLQREIATKAGIAAERAAAAESTAFATKLLVATAAGLIVLQVVRWAVGRVDHDVCGGGERLVGREPLGGPEVDGLGSDEYHRCDVRLEGGGCVEEYPSGFDVFDAWRAVAHG